MGTKISTNALNAAAMDNVVDKLDEAIKLYITRLTRGSLDEREGRRAMEIISFSINLEHEPFPYLVAVTSPERAPISD